MHAAIPHRSRYCVSAKLFDRLVRCHPAGRLLIDPGGDLDVLLAEIQRLGLSLTQIWLTHAHIDHGTGELAKRLSLPIVGPHPGDQFWIDGLPEQSAMFGFPPGTALHAHALATRWRSGADWQRGVERAPLPGAHPPVTWCSMRRRSTGRLWATCSLPGAWAAPISSAGQPPAAD